MPTPLPIPCEFTITIVEDDPDYLPARVTVGDGDFSGATKVYESHNVLGALATALDGFPSGPDDRREIILGAFGPATGGGAVRLVFRLVDRAAHAVLQAEN